VEAHLRLVVKTASQFKGYGLPVSDLVAEGNLGLMKSLEGFDPSRGLRFSTYAQWWIRAAMFEHVLRFYPAAPRFQDVHDAADDPPVVHPRLASGVRRQVRLKPRELIVCQPEKVIGHSEAPFGNLESQHTCQEKRFYRS